MANPKFRKGQWVVRVDGIPDGCDCAEIGDMRQIDESDSGFPDVTHEDANGVRDFIDQDEYRLATPEELERVK